MNISIQNLFQNLAEEAKSSRQQGNVHRPTPPEPPARLQIGRPSVPPHHFYTPAGAMGTLAKFDAPALPSMQKISVVLQAVMTDEVLVRFQAASPKISDAILATILQQCFDLLKDETKRERERRKKQKQQQEEAEKQKADVQAEEKAMDLLKTLLSHAENQKNNMAEFCKWARASVAQTQAMMKKNLGQLPEHTQKSFKILNDAIEALEHGMSPEYIYGRLEGVIDLKKGE